MKRKQICLYTHVFKDGIVLHNFYSHPLIHNSNKSLHVSQEVNGKHSFMSRLSMPLVAADKVMKSVHDNQDSCNKVLPSRIHPNTKVVKSSFFIIISQFFFFSHFVLALCNDVLGLCTTLQNYLTTEMYVAGEKAFASFRDYDESLGIFYFEI